MIVESSVLRVVNVIEVHEMIMKMFFLFDFIFNLNSLNYFESFKVFQNIRLILVNEFTVKTPLISFMW